MRLRLISVLRKPSDCATFKSRLSSEGRIPGCALINASAFSVLPLERLSLVDLAKPVVLGRRCFRFIADNLFLGDFLLLYKSPHLLWKAALQSDPDRPPVRQHRSAITWQRLP